MLANVSQCPKSLITKVGGAHWLIICNKMNFLPHKEGN